VGINRPRAIPARAVAKVVVLTAGLVVSPRFPSQRVVVVAGGVGVEGLIPQRVVVVAGGVGVEGIYPQRVVGVAGGVGVEGIYPQRVVGVASGVLPADPDPMKMLFRPEPPALICTPPAVPSALSNANAGVDAGVTNRTVMLSSVPL